MKNKLYITLAIICFFFCACITSYAGSWNISSGPEYGIDTGTKYSTQRNYIKSNIGYEKQLTKTWSGELELGYAYQMLPYNSESLSLKTYLHKYVYQGEKWDLGLYGGPGLTRIISGYRSNEPDITGELNFTLTAGLEVYREICDNVDLGIRIGVDHASNAGTGDYNTGRNGIFSLMTLKFGRR